VASTAEAAPVAPPPVDAPARPLADTPEAAQRAAARAAKGSAAAPKLIAGGRAPAKGWAYGQIRASRQYTCPGSAKAQGIVNVEITLGLETTPKGAALHVVVERKEDEDAPCSFSGKPSGLYRISYKGTSVAKGARRIYHFTSWQSGELPSGHDELTKTENGSLSLTLDCGGARVRAYAYDPSDDDENLGGFSASELPAVSLFGCKASGELAEHALFEQWLYQGQLLLAPEPGVEMRTVLYDEMDPVIGVRVGSPAPAYAILRQRVGSW